MNRQEQLKNNLDYITSEGLDKVVNFSDNLDYKRNVSDAVSGELTIPIPPEVDDLVRLHKLIRSKKSFTVLEFGTGYSTFIIADALRKNEIEWNALKEKPVIRNKHMFKIFSVDASLKWVETAKSKIADSDKERINICHSEVKIGLHQGQLCHYYVQIPDIIPDFIYLDGPDPKDVQGTVNGMSFKCDERTVMAADLLMMEPTMLPGTYIIVDGRTNNARFLHNNFKRNFDVIWDRDADITTFELSEERLGKYNILGSDYV